MKNTQNIVTVLGVLIVVLLLGLGQTNNQNQQASAQASLAVLGSRQLHLFDGNNQDLGIFIQTELPGNNAYLALNLNSNLFFRFGLNDYQRTASFYPENISSLNFESSNCSGIPIVQNGSQTTNGRIQRIVLGGVSHYYVFINTVGTNSIPRVVHSRLDSEGNQCLQLQTNMPESLQLQEITLPFTEPIAWPLRVGYPTVSSGSIE